MKVYFARLNEKQEHPHEMVGIFAAHTNNQLCDVVDECCDIDCVEVCEIGPGGIYWSGRINFPLPFKGDDEDAPEVPGGASFCEWWLGASDADAVWTQLEWDTEDA